jgi:hypothetical protein
MILDSEYADINLSFSSTFSFKVASAMSSIAVGLPFDSYDLAKFS